MYGNFPTRLVRVHRGACSFCREGRGLRNAASRNGRWEGPFDTLAEARDVAVKMELQLDLSEPQGCPQAAARSSVAGCRALQLRKQVRRRSTPSARRAGARVDPGGARRQRRAVSAPALNLSACLRQPYEKVQAPTDSMPTPREAMMPSMNSSGSKTECPPLRAGFPSNSW